MVCHFCIAAEQHQGQDHVMLRYDRIVLRLCYTVLICIHCLDLDAVGWMPVKIFAPIEKK